MVSCANLLIVSSLCVYRLHFARFMKTEVHVCPAYCIVLIRTSTDSHSLHTIFNARSLVHHHGHSIIGMVLVMPRFQTSPQPILPFTAMLNMAAKEQPDVTSRQSNSFALVCNWLLNMVRLTANH